MMNVKQLREIIQGLPDDMLVGGVGHFGEFLQCFGATVETIIDDGGWYENEMGDWLQDRVETKILAISIEDAGEEPD